MKVLGLDGKEYKLSLTDRMAAAGETRARSSGHLLARTILRELYPFDAICEEVALPGCGDSALFLDFLLPSRKLALEINGRQHTQYVPFFHGSKAGFAKSQVRDRKKAQFLALNGITLVNLDDEKRDDWHQKIQGAFIRASGPEGQVDGAAG